MTKYEDALRLLRIMDTRLLYASKVAEYARHAVLCENHGPPTCTCGLVDLVVKAYDFNTETQDEADRLMQSVGSPAPKEPR